MSGSQPKMLTPYLSLFWLNLEKTKVIADSVESKYHLDIQNRFLNRNDRITAAPLHEELWNNLWKADKKVKYNYFPRGRIYWDESLQMYSMAFGYWLNENTYELVLKKYNIWNETSRPNIELYSILRTGHKDIKEHYLYKDYKFDRDSCISFLREWCNKNVQLIEKLEETFQQEHDSLRKRVSSIEIPPYKVLSIEELLMRI